MAAIQMQENFWFNPKYKMKLRKALELIHGPNEKFNISQSLCIKQGEEILNNLSALPQYLFILAESLNFYSEDLFNVQNNHKVIFLLLLIEKDDRKIPSVIWCHLLHFFFNCNQKFEKFIISFAIKQLPLFCLANNNYQHYEKFFDEVIKSQKWRCKISYATKLLNLISSTINKFKITQPRSGEEKQLRYQIMNYIVKNNIELIKQFKNQWPHLVEPFIKEILKIVLLIAQNYEEKIFQEFTKSYLVDLFNLLQKLQSMSTTIKCVLYLIWNSIHKHPHSFFENFSIQQNIIHSLVQFLKISKRTKQDISLKEQFQIFSLFLIQFDSNYEILRNIASQVLFIYFNFITEVQINKQYEILADYNVDCENSTKKYTKFSIMTQCIKINNVQNELIKKSQIKFVIVLAYVNTLHPSEESVDRVIAYLNSIMHYSIEQNYSTVVCCLRFIYRFVVNNPNFNLIQICTCILNLRTFVHKVSHFCDLILTKVAPVIVTCSQMDVLWEFTQFWVQILMKDENVMHICAGTFYPILILLESIDDSCFVQCQNKSNERQICYPQFFSSLMEIISEQSKIDEISQVYKYSVFEIFYKMASVLMNYITAVFKFSPNQINKQDFLSFINPAVQFIFKNQLYSLQTAFIYIQSLTLANDAGKTEQFIGNMLLETFWRGFDDEEITFFSYVLIGTCCHFGNHYNPQEIFSHFFQIMSSFEKQYLISQSKIKQIKENLCNFVNLYGVKLTTSQNGFFFHQQY